MDCQTILKSYKELIVYCIIGGTGATLDFLIYSLLTKEVGIHYQIANIVSVSAGIINNFSLAMFELSKNPIGIY